MMARACDAHGLRPDDIVDAGLCVGCGCCVALSDDPADSMTWDGYGFLRPASVKRLPVHNSLFNRTCPFAPSSRSEDELAAVLFPDTRYADPEIGRFEAAYVGHVEEADYRARGSSGGMVSWMAAELLRRRMVDGVAHVVANPSHDATRVPFLYAISRSADEVRAGAGSRYFPVELSEVLSTIRQIPGRYAVVGIPCFIKAVNLLRAEDNVFAQRIVYTLGLFCGHMKSARFVESIARQMGVDPAAVAGIEYRTKAPDRPANWYRSRLTLSDGSTHEKDWWHLVDGDWGAGFFQNSACNYCDDVVAETADIAFGDAWVEPYSSDARGTNVIIIRNGGLEQILRSAAQQGNLSLQPVEASFIRHTQAAGLRQRREGLAYRLTWKAPPFELAKRVRAKPLPMSLRRRLVYRMRYLTARWSHLVFALSRRRGLFAIYLWWARAALSAYHGLTYSRGIAGRVFDLILKDR